MKAELKIEVPTNWKAVTLKKYLEMQKDIKTYEDEPEAFIAVLFHHLCGLDATLLGKIDTETFGKIKEDLINFIGNTDFPLQRIINIDGIEYGFEPNLSKISYGAYLDLTKYDNFTIDENWAKIMSILYRPVVRKTSQLYEISPYDGTIQEDKFLGVSMDIHFGSLFFFINLSKDLANYTLNSLTNMEVLPHNIKSILEKNGKLILQ